MSAPSPSPLILLACAFLAATATPAAAEDNGNAPPEAARGIDDLRGEAERLRDEAETAYQAAEAACYGRFLVNSCISDAKAGRLATIRRARALEAEAYRLELAERRRAATETAEKAERRGATPFPTEASAPTADVATPTLPPVATSARKGAAGRQATGGKKSDERAKSRARAARRAEAARRARERYDTRIRELEEKKARDEDGR
ncbi:MAG: hypothetical protein LBF91_00245 [Azoarcus sp.]|jgi:hypothetical protein|nr:hypothetical protein [Azoarcus sp.]